jgi:hypothetical protein
LLYPLLRGQRHLLHSRQWSKETTCHGYKYGYK